MLLSLQFRELFVLLSSCNSYAGIYSNSYYSGTPLLWVPWGPSRVSCIERCPHFGGKFMIKLVQRKV